MKSFYLDSQDSPFAPILLAYSVKYEESTKGKVRAKVFKSGDPFHVTGWCGSYRKAWDSALCVAHRRHFGPTP